MIHDEGNQQHRQVDMQIQYSNLISICLQSGTSSCNGKQFPFVLFGSMQDKQEPLKHLILKSQNYIYI